MKQLTTLWLEQLNNNKHQMLNNQNKKIVDIGLFLGMDYYL